MQNPDNMTGGVWTKNKDGNVKFMATDLYLEEKTKGNILPLARISATVELNMIENEVTPVVVKLTMDNYSHNSLLKITPKYAIKTAPDHQAQTNMLVKNK